ncbi:MAG: hypothetical protein PWQ61_3456, partial [Betaproteobacteria bacterium]|nr:hypothetical protein [Betaproteobacteria bacterium]
MFFYQSEKNTVHPIDERMSLVPSLTEADEPQTP